MSRTLIVYDHPYDKSFNHAILQTITDALDAKNRAYDVIDLHADGFNPVYGKEELALFGKGETLDPLVEKYQALIRAADEIVFICPIWWSSLPAMSKGFLDKVMKQKFAYIPERTGPRGLLTHIKTAVLITTSTTPNFAFPLILGNPIKRVFVKVVMKQLGFQKREWLNFGGITGSQADKREAFLAKVRQRFS